MIRFGPAGWVYSNWAGVVYPQPKPKNFDPLVLEVRHASCNEPEFFEELRERGIGFVSIDQLVFGRSVAPTVPHIMEWTVQRAMRHILRISFPVGGRHSQRPACACECTRGAGLASWSA